jgi:hypothetical protein
LGVKHLETAKTLDKDLMSVFDTQSSHRLSDIDLDYFADFFKSKSLRKKLSKAGFRATAKVIHFVQKLTKDVRRLSCV